MYQHSKSIPASNNGIPVPNSKTAYTNQFLVPLSANSVSSSLSKDKDNISYHPLNDSHYMSNSMKDYFKVILLQFKDRLSNKNNELLKSLGEKIDQERDPLDQGLVEELKYQSLIFHGRTDQILRDVQTALNKIEKGTYGYCEETEEEIGVKRLLAVPYVRYSIQAQSLKERRLFLGHP